MQPYAAAVSLLLLTASTVHAWGGEGHQVIALIAERDLTRQAQAGSHLLVGKDYPGEQAKISARRSHELGG